ncbi:MAG: LysE family translocator [Pseudomonadota bacterium]
MPDIQTVLLFVTASIVLLVIPGPTIALVIARSLSEGRRVALPLVLGVGLGDLVAATLALAGAGALLAASATAFTAVKVIGAIYLIWLGIKLFMAEPTPPTVDAANSKVGGLDAFRDGFLVTVFNPKGILFFIAFVPQFIEPDKSYIAQASFFVIAFTVLGIVNGAVYAFGADALRTVIRSSQVLRRMNQAGGVVIAAAGIAALFTKRPAI